MNQDYCRKGKMNTNITYHLVPEKYFKSSSEKTTYTPEQFEKEGFIHCTDGEYAVSVIAFNIFKKLEDNLLILFIDKSKVEAEIKYEDPSKLFPHIYGKLNKDAIVKVSNETGSQG